MPAHALIRPSRQLLRQRREEHVPPRSSCSPAKGRARVEPADHHISPSRSVAIKVGCRKGLSGVYSVRVFGARRSPLSAKNISALLCSSFFSAWLYHLEGILEKAWLVDHHGSCPKHQEPGSEHAERGQPAVSWM